MEVAPRQGALLGGLKKAVKGVAKGISGILKSDVGKLGLLAGGAYFAPTLFGKAAGFGNFGSLLKGGLSKGLGKLAGEKTLGKTLGVMAGGTVLGGVLGALSPEEQEEVSTGRNIEALRGKLTTAYQNLGYDESEIPALVDNDLSEYTSGAGGYAEGGRIGYSDGTEFEKYLEGREKFNKEQNVEQLYKEFLENKRRQKVAEQKTMAANGGRIGYNDGTNLKKDFLIKKGYGDMVKNMSVIEIDQLFNSVKGTTTAANTYREPAYMGGRMGYAEGPQDPTYTGNNMEDLPRGLQIDTTTSNPIPNDAPQKEISEVAKIMLGPGRSGIGEPEDGTMKGYQFFRTQYLPKKVTEIAENYGMKESEVLTMIREEMMKYIDTPKSLEKPKMAYGGRINRAFGSDDLVEQASGIEGLDININPKGVKELDLRETGGFIPPVGVKEKADDIPAMLSNNEFVFTADAVRGMGDGNVNKGAQRMYDMMKKLEKGGRV